MIGGSKPMWDVVFFCSRDMIADSVVDCMIPPENWITDQSV